MTAGKLMISCRLATELIEKKHHAGLSWRERVLLPLHLALCDACRQYQVQSSLLEKLFHTKQQEDDDTNLFLSPDENTGRLEWQILQKIDKQEGLSQGH